MLIKNQEIKMRKIGSESTISQDSITDELKDIRTTDDQSPKSNVSLSSNPGRAIYAIEHSEIVFFFIHDENQGVRRAISW